MWSFMAMRIVHRFTMERSAVLDGMLSARRESAVITLTKVVMMIHVTVEMFPSMKPWSCADEEAA